MKYTLEERIQKVYEIAKEVYLGNISVSQGARIVADFGLKQSSALDYIYAYYKLREGKLYTRTINAYATDYYLKEIYYEFGNIGLRKALLSLDQHITYYEQTSGAKVKKGREIYNRYFDLVKENYAETVFPDEVDNEIKYFEGKTKQIIVNSYERNQLARQECIEHFGLSCQVCDFNFQEKFGELGRNFIHVHHLIDIATVGKEYSVNPKTDLIPVCPNCHAMLHKKKPAFSILELKQLIK
ncbi:HNH endonuclease [Flavobacterium tyrosinilyticum]|uniref:HNH endonuclease n=1 Tax=Flavobacterium tyrosinilyticum TaxID=1658740 RepID=UPI0020306D17|nr:HNH endonuclease [Flavobacterium tyrosinilyticum]MCM0666387.1 HNH endonuclease [Flavobacterium tyrosinilyticum]